MKLYEAILECWTIDQLLDKFCFDLYPMRVVISFGARVAWWTNKQTDKYPYIIN